jgi:hypothetical protein
MPSQTLLWKIAKNLIRVVNVPNVKKDSSPKIVHKDVQRLLWL